jgi:hypothetical protein
MALAGRFLPPLAGEVAPAQRETKGAAPPSAELRHPLSQSATQSDSSPACGGAKRTR